MSNSTSSLEPTSLIESSIMHINSQPKFVTNAIVNALRTTSIISSSLSGAVDFDGDDEIVIADDDTLDIAGTITLEGWVKTTDATDFPMLLNKGTVNTAYLMFIPTGGVSPNKVAMRVVASGESAPFDGTFVSGIQYLMKEKIINIHNLPEQTSAKTKPSFVDESKDPQSYVDRYNNEPSYKEWFDENYSDYTIQEAVGIPESVPTWIKNNADWWAQGLITEDDFVKGIYYLVEHGIVRVN